jgi:hypothetical protein
MHKKYPLRAFFFLSLTTLGISASVHADTAPISVEKSTNGVTLANSQVWVEINLKDASYSIVDANDGTIAIAHAHGEVDGLGGNPEKTFSTRQLDPHEEVSWKTNAVADALGNGTMLTLTVKRQDDREYFTTFTLHDDKSFVALGSGIVNHRSYPIRVRSFQPLVGGEVFPGLNKTAMKTLNGAAGSSRAEVKEGYDRACENSLLFTCMANGKRRSLVIGGLTYQDFAKYAAIGVYELWDTYPDTKGVDLGQTWKTVWARPRGVWKEKKDFAAQVAAVDPVGRLVDPGTSYQPNDLFYVDVSTDDPFQALETYGLALRDATKSHPNTYNNLTVCGWFSHRDTSDQLVKEMDVAVTKGMLKTIPVTVRLEPDTYCGVDNGNTEQGWWDDAHWAKYGHLTPPYDTFKKFIDAVHERGGKVETYFQCGMPSDDFAEAHPDYMLHKDISLLHRRHLHVHPLVTYDPTSTGFQDHMHKVWSHLKEAGLSGVKFDYPDIAWRPEGGFEDPHATTASAYRKWFQLCRDGLGPDALIHERALGINCLDVTAGIVDMQRVWSDSDKWEQGMASTCGLRWYKNRVVMGYYPDSKSFVAFDAAGKRLKDVSLAPLPRQALITMLYVTSGRIESALSLETLSPEVIHDIGRAFPMHSSPQSARPVDAFTGTKSPKVYSFRVDDHWQQVTLYNQEKTPVTISSPLSGEQASTGSLGLNPEKNYFVYEFWSDRLVGKFSGNGVLSEKLASGEARMYSVREVLDHPQILSTNRHLMQGYVDLSDVRWDASSKTLSGTAKVVAGEPFRIVLAKNGAHAIKTTATDAVATLEPNASEGNLVALIINSKENKSIPWIVQFE